MRSRFALAASLATLTGTGILAGQMQAPPFRSGVELASFDFRAEGPEGRPVPDLAAGDLVLKVDGRTRPIASLQFVSLDTGEPAHRSTAATQLPPPFGTNTAADAGRNLVLVIEKESIRPGVARLAIKAVARILDLLSPRDRVSVITMPRGGIQTDLTTDRERVRRILEGVAGDAGQQTTDSERACRTRLTLEGLADLFNALASVDGPKTVVFLSSGLAMPTRDAPMTRAPGPCELRSVQYDEVGKAANAARVHVYVIKPNDLIVDSAANSFADVTASRFQSSDVDLAGLESLAGATDGDILRLNLNITEDTVFSRIARETAGYYLVGFEPDASDRNGLSHRIELSTARADVKLRVRPRLTIQRAAGRVALTPHAMLRDGKAYRDLPLRTAAFASKDVTDSRLKVVAIADPVDPTAALSSVSFALIDGNARLVAQWTADPRELMNRPAISAGLAPPGDYRLRVAAVDNTGRRGAAEYDFAARLTPAGPFKLSTLALGTSRTTGFLPRLQFLGEPTATGYFEVYGNPGSAEISVALELARTTDGGSIVRVPAALIKTNDPDRRIATGVVPVGTLLAGDYIVRGVVSLDSRPQGYVSQTLRKVVP